MKLSIKFKQLLVKLKDHQPIIYVMVSIANLIFISIATSIFEINDGISYFNIIMLSVLSSFVAFIIAPVIILNIEKEINKKRNKKFRDIIYKTYYKLCLMLPGSEFFRNDFELKPNKFHKEDGIRSLIFPKIESKALKENIVEISYYGDLSDSEYIIDSIENKILKKHINKFKDMRAFLEHFISLSGKEEDLIKAKELYKSVTQTITDEINKEYELFNNEKQKIIKQYQFQIDKKKSLSHSKNEKNAMKFLTEINDTDTETIMKTQNSLNKLAPLEKELSDIKSSVISAKMKEIKDNSEKLTEKSQRMVDYLVEFIRSAKKSNQLKEQEVSEFLELIKTKDGEDIPYHLDNYNNLKQFLQTQTKLKG